MNTLFRIAALAVLMALPQSDPYASLNPEERALLKPQIERWIHDQTKHAWSDMWEIQDQTPELKNELLLGRRDAPDMDRAQYVQAMRETIGIGYPEITAFALRAVSKEKDSFSVEGCAAQRRESWKQTSMVQVDVKIVAGKAKFGLFSGTPDLCKL
jgi:hypothetical protein